MAARNTLGAKRIARHSRLPRRKTPADVAMGHANNEGHSYENYRRASRDALAIAIIGALLLIWAIIPQSEAFALVGIIMFLAGGCIFPFFRNQASKALDTQRKWIEYAEDYEKSIEKS